MTCKGRGQCLDFNKRLESGRELIPNQVLVYSMGAFSIKMSRTCYSGKTFETFVGKLIYIFESLECFFAQKVSKYDTFFGPYFSVFSPNTGKCGPQKAPYLDSFYAMSNIYES